MFFGFFCSFPKQHYLILCNSWGKYDFSFYSAYPLCYLSVVFDKGFILSIISITYITGKCKMDLLIRKNISVLHPVDVLEIKV